jgi:hypothetical protein
MATAGLATGHAPWTSLLLLVIAPLLEELVFRAGLQEWLLQQHIRPLTAELDACFTQTLRTRDGKAFHAGDFLQPFNDVRVVIDNQRVCHCFPIKPEADVILKRARVSEKCLPSPTGTINARCIRP